MRTAMQSTPPHTLAHLAASLTHTSPLTSTHLLTHEPTLRRALARLIPFRTHSLYFPPDPPTHTQWIPTERTLLIPLRYEGTTLGVFAARGVQASVAKRLLPSLPALVELCMENLALTCQSRCDALTGLALPHILLERVARQLETAPHAGEDTHKYDVNLCTGIMVIRWHNMHAIAIEYGHIFADTLLRVLCKTICRNLPQEILVAYTAEGEYALHLPIATHGLCRKLLKSLLPGITALALPLPLLPSSGQKISPRCSVGYALYPQDMNAKDLAHSTAERARILLHKARLAQYKAYEDTTPPHSTPALAYAHISTCKDNTQDKTYKELTRQITTATRPHTHFSLALVRLVRLVQDNADITQTFLDLARRYSEQTDTHFLGLYEQHTGIFLHPHTPRTSDAINTPDMHQLWQNICVQHTAQGIDMCVGLASYPSMNITKAEMLECCRKALDLALLLPAPQVGMFGSLALNISADKLYSQGNMFEAVAEYQHALLADNKNALAWNSLGVCMATLSRYPNARRHFMKALRLNPQDAATLYNLGNVCQNMGQNRTASYYYRQCLKNHAEHYFAHIRLGQLAENAQRYTKSKNYYTAAAQLETTHAQAHSGLAYRLLAQVALQQKQPAHARELLHEALLRNPEDAVALELLAQSYLEGNEDPHIAEMLARKSLGTRPKHAHTWHILAQALSAQGRHIEAKTAASRA